MDSRAYQSRNAASWWRAFGSLIRENWLNWLVFACLLLGLLISEFVTTPYERHITPHGWESLKFPAMDSTVPSWAVPLYAVVLPVILTVAYYLVSKCEIREFHDLLFAVLVNVAITAAATNFLKETLGRPRPNFFERCYGDTYPLNETLPFDSYNPPDCTNPNKDAVKEGRRSFPSGHSSWAMCSMFFITLFLMGKLHVFDGRGRIWKFVISALPTWIAIGIGITRINDYMHHWTDVVAGFLLGMLVATLVYLMYYPWPFARSGTSQPLYRLRELSSNPDIRHEAEITTIMEEGTNDLGVEHLAI